MLDIRDQFLYLCVLAGSSVIHQHLPLVLRVGQLESQSITSWDSQQSSFITRSVY